MIPGGFTENISYFAGYLFLDQDFLLGRHVYDGQAVRVVWGDDPGRRPQEADRGDDAEDLTAGRTRPPEMLELLDTIKARALDLRLNLSKFRHDDEEGDALRPLPRPSFVFPSAGGSAPGGENPQIRVTYEPGGGQKFVQIDQISVLGDNDSYGVAYDGERIGSVETIAEMIGEAAAQTPSGLALPHDTYAGNGSGSLVEIVAARDAATAESGGGPGAFSIAPGVYLDGVLQDDGATRPTLPEPATLGPSEGYGQWAVVGGNDTDNAAQIVDASGASRAMIVLGDVFQMDTIVQVNLLRDSDALRVNGPAPGEPLQEHFLSGANHVHNIAEFIQNETVFPASAKFAGFNWHVDVVEGNFYNVNYLRQINALFDDDVVRLEDEQSHFAFQSGENGQFNWAQTLDLTIEYDIIIVAGNYHGANFIFQTNIVLDVDFALMFAPAEGGDAATQYAASGQNALQNEAVIARYGGDVFEPLDPALKALADFFAARGTTLDPSFGGLLPGNGSNDLKILYVSGDYFDVNVIDQTNIISDADTVELFFSGAPIGGAVTQTEDGVGADPTTGYTQSASAGGNQATNRAEIIDLGSAVTYVGGEVYQDAMLVQANLVTDTDSVQYNDTQTLVPELIAFLNAPGEGEGDPPPTPVKLTAMPDDQISHVLS